MDKSVISMDNRKLSSHPDLRHYRAIALLDLDCFYAQVEHVRLGIPHSEPLAVQQWNGLIAVNYACRAKGVKRHCSPEDARKLIPEIHLVHCATYAPGESVPKYHQSVSYATHKISLEPYRKASMEIFRVISSFTSKFQRASIDEAFLDLTEMAMQRMMERLTPEEIERDWLDGPEVVWNAENVIVGGATHAKGWKAMLLNVASEIVAQIRKQVWDELHFTVSAGIANSKTVAKLVAGLNKPNKQTIIPDDEIPNHFQTLPFKSIRMLGGKLGKTIHETLQADTAGELWKYSLEDLQRHVGEDGAKWLYDILRGVCHEEVSVGGATVPKSMMAAKSFRPGLKTKEQVDEWIHTLSAEIFYRLNDDAEFRWPKTLSISFKTADLDKGRSCSFPPRSALTSPTVIAAKASALFWTDEVKKNPLLVFRMTIQANGLEGEKGLEALDKWFGNQDVTEDSFTCERCKQTLSNDKRDEHNDWHVAMDISKEWKAGVAPKGVKRKAGQPSISNFFKKA